ncbi:MAG TPA: hypothetical protein PKY70_10990 [Nakamurella multipartita]|nr:hypothetical protein [Nakamurella multipartita]
MTILEKIGRALADEPATVVVEPPGVGHGFWAGGPSVVHTDGRFHLAYRLRRPVDQGRGYANVVATSDDGIHFTTVATLPVEMFASASLERPALIRRPDGGWRIYVSCSTFGSKHWWVEAVDTAPGGDIADLAAGTRTVVLAGDATSAWKDVVVTREGAAWQMWACEHLLDQGDDEADRMRSVYLTSTDGLTWTPQRIALAPTPGRWDGRGVRITSAWRSGDQWLASYDGRASAAENWFERTGLAVGASPAEFAPVAGPIDRDGHTLRYVTLAQLPAGLQVYFEAQRPDGSNDLRTVFVPA